MTTLIPQHHSPSTICPDFTADEIAQEPMLYAADLYEAGALAGPITRVACMIVWETIRRSRAGNRVTPGNVIVDTRIHMLKPGWYPAIPGWHMDELPRDEVSGQPDIFDKDRDVEPLHYLVSIDAGTGSLTQFLDEPLHVEGEDFAGAPYVWGRINELVDEIEPRILQRPMNTVTYPSGAIVEFGYGDIHRAMPATASGWRFFLRATIRSRRKIENKVRTQVQTYIPHDKMNGGW